MSDSAAKKLSREETAKIEIGRTDVARPVQYVLTGFFLLVIFLYPLMQFCSRSPIAEWRRAETVQAAIKAYETGIEETSLLREWLLPPVQQLMIRLFSLGNEKVIIGSGGWLFFSGDYDYLVNSGFLRQENLRKRRLAGVQPDPVAAIKDFNRQLKLRGIRLILLPVPSKPAIYPDRLGASAAEPCENPSWGDFLRRMKQEDIPVIDLTADFAQMRKQMREPYLKTDTHWTPAGMELAAARISEILSAGISRSGYKSTAKPIRHSAVGDIAAMLKLPHGNHFFPPETVQLTPVPKGPETISEILLLGDSFTNIYSLEAMNWGTRSGLAETLSAKLGRPVDALVRNDAGAFASRQLLAQELNRGSDRLRGKKFVVWEFAMRELAAGDWKMIELPRIDPVKPKKDSPGKSGRSDRIAEAAVLAVSPVPRPHSAPYKDHVMILYLELKNGEKILVYTVSMKDNVWQAAAKLRPGTTVRLRLYPWADYKAQYGPWNRSELDDDELLILEPFWAEIL